MFLKQRITKNNKLQDFLGRKSTPTVEDQFGTHSVPPCIGFYGLDMGGMVVECIVGNILFVLENPSHKCF
jgi:hypothetical protein